MHQHSSSEKPIQVLVLINGISETYQKLTYITLLWAGSCTGAHASTPTASVICSYIVLYMYVRTVCMRACTEGN